MSPTLIPMKRNGMPVRLLLLRLRSPQSEIQPGIQSTPVKSGFFFQLKKQIRITPKPNIATSNLLSKVLKE